MGRIRQRSGERSESKPRFKRDSDRSRDSPSRGRGSNRSSRDSPSRGRGSSDRFSRDSPRRGSSDRFSRPRRDEPVMHSVTCDECHKKCEVPFLPTSSKPVYCSDCFRKHGDSKSNAFESEFEEINNKLDKIMKVLDA